MPADTAFTAPATTEQALADLAQDDSIALAGGTSVAILLKSGLMDAARLVYLGRIPELSGIAERPGGDIWLGATVTLRELCRSPLIAQRIPVLASAAAQVGNPRVRAVATLGGAVAHADPRQDLPPVLLALGARVQIASPEGTREMPLAGFLLGFMETALEQGELITGIVIPGEPGQRAAYHRFTPASADDYPAVSVAAAVSAHPDGTIRQASIALGGAGPTAIAATQAAGLLLGQPLEPAVIETAAAAAAEAADPSDDQRGSADYKRAMVAVWTRRALQSCATQQQPG